MGSLNRKLLKQAQNQYQKTALFKAVAIVDSRTNGDERTNDLYNSFYHSHGKKTTKTGHVFRPIKLLSFHYPQTYAKRILFH